MQSYETPEIVVHETFPEEAADASKQVQNQWTGDQAIYLTLAGSALATAATVPVMLAVWGPTPMLKLMYAAVLAGLLVGMTGLFVVGSAVGLMRVVRAMRSGQAIPKVKPSRGLRGKLAFS